MIHAVRIIEKKRDGETLSDEEIREFIRASYTNEIPDYQVSAFLMACFFRNLSLPETMSLTQAMLDSGERYEFSEIPGVKVDKHSTGGVGDKVSIILAPLAAACGVKVPMMAGRSLGHTGGTVDKLQSIPRFRTQLSKSEVSNALLKSGCVIMGQSETIAPADRKLYALRDVTGTIECIPLIVASILSKKLAEGTNALVMDVKVGNGAFMKTRKDAKALAQQLIRVGKAMKLTVRVVITDMSQPLGRSAGNSLEVVEAIQVLRGQNGHGVGPKEKSTEHCLADLKELTLALCAEMLVAGKVVKSIAEGRKRALQKLTDGSAWEHFKKMVTHQGGDLQSIENPSLLPLSSHLFEVKSKRKGFVTAMDTAELGRVVVDLGGGRHQASDTVDPSVGLLFCRKLGEKINTGEALVKVYAKPDLSETTRKAIEARILSAIQIQGSRKTVPKLILETL